MIIVIIESAPENGGNKLDIAAHDKQGISHGC